MSDLIERIKSDTAFTTPDEIVKELEAQQAEISAHENTIESQWAEIARLRRGLENACMCLGRIRSDKDASYAAEGHDKARAVLEQKP